MQVKLAFVQIRFLRKNNVQFQQMSSPSQQLCCVHFLMYIKVLHNILVLNIFGGGDEFLIFSKSLHDMTFPVKNLLSAYNYNKSSKHR